MKILFKILPSYSQVNKFFRISLVTILMISWVFSGWPRVFDFPPRVEMARAAMTLRGTPTNVHGTTLSSPFQITLPVPSGVTNGDLMFVWIGSYGTATITTNAAWTLKGSYTAGTTDHYYLYARVANNEPASYVWTFSATSKYKATSIAYASDSTFSVTNPATDITVSNTSYRTSDVNNRAASFSVPNANSNLIFFGGNYSTTVRTQLPPTVPGTFIEDYDVGHATPDFSLEVANYLWSGSGATGIISSTISAASATKHAFAVALKPPTPVSPTVTSPTQASVQQTTATLGANVTSLGVPASITERGTCWGTSANPTTNCLAEGNTTTGAFTQNRTGLPAGTLIYYRGYAINSTGTGYSADDSFTTLTPTDSDSAVEVHADGAQANFDIIPINDTSGEKFSVLKFQVSDKATADSLPTLIDQITIPISGTGANASTDIAWAELWDDTNNAQVATAASITNFAITFGSTPNSGGTAGLDTINSASAIKYSVRVYMKNSKLTATDGLTYIFAINDSNIGTDTSTTASSQMRSNASAVSNVTGTINVAHSQLVFSTQPPTTADTNIDFTGSVVVSATDANNNVDTGFSENITLSAVIDTTHAAPSGTLSSTDSGGLTKSPANGLATWVDIKYTAGEVIDLKAVSTTYSSGVFSTAVTVTAGPEIVFVQEKEIIQNFVTATTYNSVSVTLDSPATAGNLLIAAIGTDKNAGSYTIPSGFTVINDKFGTSVSGALAYKIATGGETTISWTTANYTGGSSLWVGEYAGISGVILDVAAENETTAETAVKTLSSGTTAATTKANELAVAMAVVDSSTNINVGRSWTNGFSEISYPTGCTDCGAGGLSVASKNLTTIGAQESTFTTTAATADQMYASIATFKVSSGATISSSANQSFTVDDGPTPITTISITDSATTPAITAANDIRITIPSSFNMTWDTSDTLANIAGANWAKTGAASSGGTVSVTYEDSNRTVVIPVTADFSASNYITVYGLSFANFSAPSAADNLELEINNAGTVADEDDKTITIISNIISYWKDGKSVGNLTSTTDWQEISGITQSTLSANSSYLWMQSDGAVNKIFAVNPSNAASMGEWTLSGVSGVDYEDLSSARINNQSYIYLADMGDNASSRSTITIYRIVEPTITGSNGTISTGDIEAITIEYPSGSMPSHKDAETLLVDPDTGDMYIITKRESVPGVYFLAHAASYSGTQTLTDLGNMFDIPDVSSVAASGNAVGGNISPDGEEILIKSYDVVYLFYRNKATQTIIQALQGTPTEVTSYVGGGNTTYRKSHPSQEPQGEAITFDYLGQDYYTMSEFVATEGSTDTQYPLFKYERLNDIPTTVTFQQGVSPDGSYSGTLDTYIWDTNPDTSYGTAVTIVADLTDTLDVQTDQRKGLIKFDVSSIPANATIVGARLDLYDSVEGQGWKMHRMLVDWNESSTYNSLTAGVDDDNVDASSVEDVRNGVTLDTIVGSIRNNMNVDTVQGWVDGTYPNYGWLLESTNMDGQQFATKEDTISAQRPKLILSYVINSSPLILSSSANQSFVVGDSATPITTISITDNETTPTITAANDIRIRIPASFNMTWDTSDTLANIAGSDWAKTGAASSGGTVSVTYEDNNKTIVIPVTSDFVTGDYITIYGLSVANFTAASSADNLELVVSGTGGATADEDNRTIVITEPGTDVSLAASAPTNFKTDTAGQYFGTFKMGGIGTVSSLTLTEYGTGPNPELELLNVKLMQDDGDGSWEPGSDTTQLGSTVSFTQSGTVTFSNFSLSAGDTSYVHVILDVSPNVIPLPLPTIGLQITQASHVTSNGEVNSPTWPIQAGLSTLSAIYPYLLDAATTSIKVYWLSSSNSVGTVEYGSTTSYGASVNDAGSTALGSLYIHKATITGLSAGTTYHYKVTDNGVSSADATFKTAPTVGSAFDFLVFGDIANVDAQYQNTNFFPLPNNVLNVAATINPQTMAIIPGDHQHSGAQGEWNPMFFLPARNILKNTAVYHVQGNHDTYLTATTDFSNLFDAPTTGGSGSDLYYSFDYGNIHFVVLDGNTSRATGGAQYNWLKADMATAAAQNADWRVLSTHQPGVAYGGAHNDDNDAGLMAAIAALGSEPGVTKNFDLVLMGHNHVYERSYRAEVNGGSTWVTVSKTGGSTYSPPACEPGDGTCPLLQYASPISKFGYLTFSSTANNLIGTYYELDALGSANVTPTVGDVFVLPVSAIISSATAQSFEVDDTATAISTITIKEVGSSPVITAANDIRIKIPADLYMTWDTTDTLANIAGTDWAKTGAASSGAAVTVTYEDSGKTLVVPVTSNFAAADDITISGLSFTNFTEVSTNKALELEVNNAGNTINYDNRRININPASAFVQSASFGDPYEATAILTSITATLGTAATANNLLVTAIATDKAAGTYTVPTGFTRIGTAYSSANVSCDFAYKIATGGETNITWNYSTASRGSSMWVGEYEGNMINSVLDASSVNNSGTTAVNTLTTGTTGVTSQADTLSVAFFGIDSAEYALGSRSWTNNFTEVDYVSTMSTAGLGIAHKSSTATSTQETTVTWAPTTDQACAGIAAFKFSPVSSLTFSISDDSVGFGNISSTDDFFATGDLTGSSTEVEAHTISASTNVAGGYVMDVLGATLTNTSTSTLTINPIGATNSTSAIGTEQFGLRLAVNSGTGTVSSPYAASGFAYDATATTTSVIATGAGDSSTTIFSLRYLVNTSNATELGDYTTTLTYKVTATF